MATFPTVKFEWRDLTEAPESVVARAPMERGVAKQRRVNSDARVEMPMTLHFDTAAEATAFETWFYVDIKAGQDFFNFTHPRTGAALLARIVGGELGPLSFLQPTLAACKRTIKLEWWRQAW